MGLTSNGGRVIRRAGLAAAALFLAAVCVKVLPQTVSTQGSDVVAFVGARLISGDGSAPIENATFIVRSGKIVQVGTKNAVKLPRGATQVNLAGKTVIPMLVDVHVHAGYLKNGPTDPQVKDGKDLLGGHVSRENYSRESIIDELRRYRYYGIGAVQSLGAERHDIELQIRNDQRSGKLNDPTLALLFTAGDGIVAYNNGQVNGGPPFAPDVVHEAATPDQAREFVRQEAAKKVDLIKFWVDDRNRTKPLMAPKVYQAIVDEARTQNLPAYAHIFNLEDAKGVAKAGVNGIVHPVRDQLVDNELLRLMKEHDVFQASTISAGSPDRTWLDEPQLAETVPQVVIAGLKAARRNPAPPQAANPNAPPRGYSLTLLNEKTESDAGIRIVIGGDTGGGEGWLPGYTEHRELQSLAEAGITPLQVIHDGTQAGADLLGLRDMDSLVAGKRADFIVLNGNPLDHMKNTRNISAVYVDGKAIDRAGMRERWAREFKTYGN
jgi:imidazolonepropionase-like amidohydrolase